MEAITVVERNGNEDQVLGKESKLRKVRIVSLVMNSEAF